MADQNVNGLPLAALPLLGTDKIVVTRDGVNLNQATVADLPSGGGSGGVAGVSTFNGRSGVVNPQVEDYDSFFLTPAEGNASYAPLVHTHVSTEITDFVEAAQDATGEMVTGNTEDGVSVTYNDASNKLDFANTDKGSTAVTTHVAEADPHGQYKVAVLDEGTSLTTFAKSLNFTGSGVTATNTGDAVTLNIPGNSSIPESSIIQVVSTVSQLRLLDKTRYQSAILAGYLAEGDGVYGQYYLDDADTTSFDNGYLVIVANDGGRWKKVEKTIIFNADPRKMKKWRAAYANYIAGLSNAKIICVGDSTTLGNGGGTGVSDQVGARVNSYPVRFAEIIGRVWGNVDANSNFNYNGGLNVLPSEYNPSIAMGAGWGALTGTISGTHFANSTTTDDLTFTIEKSIDRVKIVYAQASGNGTFTVSVNNTIVGTVNSSATPSRAVAQTFTFAATTAPSVVKINRVSGSVLVATVEGFLSTKPEITVANYGFSGARAQSFSTSGANQPANADTQLAHGSNLTIFMMTINDIASATAIETYRTNMTAFIQAALVQGSVLLMTGFPPNRTNATNGVLDGIVRVNYELAKQFDVPLFDFNSLFESYAAANAFIPYKDDLHLTAQGYAEAARAVAQFLDVSV